MQETHQLSEVVEYFNRNQRSRIYFNLSVQPKVIYNQETFQLARFKTKDPYTTMVNGINHFSYSRIEGLKNCIKGKQTAFEIITENEGSLAIGFTKNTKIEDIVLRLALSGIEGTLVISTSLGENPETAIVPKVFRILL